MKISLVLTAALGVAASAASISDHASNETSLETVPWRSRHHFRETYPSYRFGGRVEDERAPLGHQARSEDRPTEEKLAKRTKGFIRSNLDYIFKSNHKTREEDEKDQKKDWEKYHKHHKKNEEKRKADAAAFRKNCWHRVPEREGSDYKLEGERQKEYFRQRHTYEHHKENDPKYHVQRVRRANQTWWFEQHYCGGPLHPWERVKPMDPVLRREELLSDNPDGWAKRYGGIWVYREPYNATHRYIAPPE